MSITGYSAQIEGSSYAVEEQLPAIFTGFASLGFVLVLLSIVLSVYLSPMNNPGFHFGGDGLNTALLTRCMSMTAVAAALVFYIRCKGSRYSALFWLVLAAACVAISLDAQLHFLSGGIAIPGGWAGTLVFYCLGTALGFALFGREIRRSRTFMTLFAAAAGFFVICAGIDALVPGTFIWKVVVSEGSRLISAFLLLLATSARLVLLIEQLHMRHRRFG